MSPAATPQIEEALSAEEFFRRGPLQPDVAAGWAGEAWTRDDMYNDHPTFRLPPSRPTAEQFLAAMDSIAGTDRPAKDYPEDFFSRDVIYADHD